MEGDGNRFDFIRDNSVIDGHNKVNTVEVKGLLIKDIYQKLNRPNFFDIGLSYDPLSPEFRFTMCTEMVHNIYLLHLFVSVEGERVSFCIHTSSTSNLMFKKTRKFNNNKSVVFLTDILKQHNFALISNKSQNYITTFSFSELEIDLLRDKSLCIPILIEDMNHMMSSHPDVIESIRLKHDFGSLLLNPIGSDFVIESSDKEKFPVHRILFGSKSEVFRAMLEGDTAENINNLVQVEYDKEILNYVREFMYTGKLKNLDEITISNLGELLKFADQYAIPGLLELIQHALAQHISRDNVFDMLLAADSYNSDTLKNKIYNFMKRNLVAIHDCKFQ